MLMFRASARAVATLRLIDAARLAGMCSFVAAASFCVPLAARAQVDSSRTAPSSATTAALRLKLRQQDESPVAGAEVSVKSGKVERVSRSDASGLVVADGLAAGSVEIRVRRIGFSQAQMLARVALGENEFTINIDGSSVALDEMRVVGNKPVVGRLEDFEMRLKRGDANTVFTWSQIEKRNPIALSQMLRGIPGIQIEDSLGLKIVVSSRGQKMARNGLNNFLDKCVLRIAVDGVIMPEITNLDAIVPRDVYGLEVFNGPSRLPPQLGSGRSDNWCGLIAIWTKSG